MPTLIDYRRRIRAVQNTQKITRAMKLVSAARLRRAQARMFSARPYARMMLEVLRSLALRAEVRAHPLLQKRPEERLLVLLLTGDRGLCGSFNTNILRLAEEFLARQASAPLLITIGKKGRDFYRRHRREIYAEYINLFLRRVEYAHARSIAARVIDLYTQAEIDAVYLIYNEFKSVLAQRLIVEKLLPIEGVLPTRMAGAIVVKGGAAAPLAAAVDYIYEQPPEAIFASLLPRHIEVQLFRALLESAAAEQAARMMTMDAATNNAAEMIDQLTLEMNKVRQASITREIIEVVSAGAAV